MKKEGCQQFQCGGGARKVDRNDGWRFPKSGFERCDSCSKMEVLLYHHYARLRNLSNLEG